MIKLFAFDLDGTLLDSSSKLNENVISSLRKLDENGIRFLIATGRVSRSVNYMMEKIGIDNPFVANNGAISFLDKDNILKLSSLDINVVKELISFCHLNGLYYHFYDVDTFYSEYFVEDRIKHLKTFDNSKDSYQVDIVITDNPIKEIIYKNSSILKLQIYVPEDHKKSRNEIMNYLKNSFLSNLSITSSSDHIIEIMTKGVSKWNCILDISNKLGIKDYEIAAIGDQDNDFSMVKNSKIGFAMGNANDKLKSIADFIVKSNDDFGVIDAINRVLEFNKNV